MAFCINGESINQFRWMLRNLDGKVIRELRGGSSTTDVYYQFRWMLHNLDGKVIREFRGGSSTPDVYYDYAYRGDQLLAAEVRNAGGGYDTRHYTLDHLGTPRLVTDDAKNRVAGVLMRDRSTGLIKGVQSADKTVRYRPKGPGSTNVELDLASGKRIVIHIRHR